MKITDRSILFGLLILWSGIATWAIAGYPATFVLAGLFLVLLLASMILYSVLAPAPLQATDRSVNLATPGCSKRPALFGVPFSKTQIS